MRNVSEEHATMIDGFKCYDADIAWHNDDFEINCFRVYQEYIPLNFWYRSRNEIIETTLSKFIKPSHKNYIEIGCGNGFTLKHLREKFIGLNFSACDIYVEALKYARENNSDEIDLFQYNLFKKNLDKQFDVIGCFDVLEHIQEDETALNNIQSLLSRGGIAVITVPSDPKLWSNNDVINKHKRRYTKSELIARVENSGFSVLYINHFVFFLYPLLLIKAKLQMNKNTAVVNSNDIASLLNLRIPKLLNSAFYRLMKFETILIRFGIKFPFGSSLICVVGKKDIK